ncbi:MAG TPA: NAD(P)H-hydrate dehydratase [Pirellulales bacterium]|nr:NAD(P)H-hydrate dehydratase [Pirellulales bacterium]
MSEPLPKLPPREPDAHKGSFGTALLVGGARGMTGAISLAGMAALRGGAGLVRLAVAATSQDIVAGFEPSYMTTGLACDEAGRIGLAAREVIGELAGKSTAIGCGPGLGQSAELNELVAWLYTQLKQPAVFDADALNALAAQADVLSRAAGPRILTPHPGEFQRLIGARARMSRQEMEAEAVALAARAGIVVLLKGHRTLITDGQRQARNTTGNPGMATGGTGDVLTGLTTALLCQQLSPFDAARLAAHLHGLAGDLAAEELGEVSLIASDLVRSLPAAFLQLANELPAF